MIRRPASAAISARSSRARRPRSTSGPCSTSSGTDAGRRDGALPAGGTPARPVIINHRMRVDHEKREIVCSVGDLVYESTYRRIGVERGDGFRRMWIGQDIHQRRAEFRAATDVNYRAEVHVVHRIERRGWGITITGRIDGLSVAPEKQLVSIGEVKPILLEM